MCPVLRWLFWSQWFEINLFSSLILLSACYVCTAILKTSSSADSFGMGFNIYVATTHWPSQAGQSETHSPPETSPSSCLSLAFAVSSEFHQGSTFKSRPTKQVSEDWITAWIQNSCKFYIIWSHPFISYGAILFWSGVRREIWWLHLLCLRSTKPLLFISTLKRSNRDDCTLINWVSGQIKLEIWCMCCATHRENFPPI